MTDQQIATHLLNKKKLFVDACKELVLTDEWDGESEMAFHHVCTVLEHAAKIVTTPIDNILQHDANISQR